MCNETIKEFIRNLRAKFEDNLDGYGQKIVEQEIAMYILEKSITDILLEDE